MENHSLTKADQPDAHFVCLVERGVKVIDP
jgi:hypothetical protein